MLSGLLAAFLTRILLNGIPGESITQCRGLWQGDPLSPMLFILVMDTMNLLISQATIECLLQPLSSRSIQHQLSLSVNDVVLLLQPTASDIDVTTSILELFGEVMGLYTNIQKSSVTIQTASLRKSRSVF